MNLLGAILIAASANVPSPHPIYGAAYPTETMHAWHLERCEQTSKHAVRAYQFKKIGIKRHVVVISNTKHVLNLVSAYGYDHATSEEDARAKGIEICMESWL
jgi:hypothetical protein